MVEQVKFGQDLKILIKNLDSDGDRQKILVLDPVRQEEQVLSGIISIAINKHREVINFHRQKCLVHPTS